MGKRKAAKKAATKPAPKPATPKQQTPSKTKADLAVENVELAGELALLKAALTKAEKRNDQQNIFALYPNG